MSVITNHWSGSGPVRLRAYHVEIARKLDLDPAYLTELRALWGNPIGARHFDSAKLKQHFTIYKNDELTEKTDYGTWDFNSDPRDNTPNIEVASMCMPKGATAFDGPEPFTIAHAWCHAYISAVIAKLKGLDTNGSFPASVSPAFQNGPIYVVSTHGQRAFQTVNFGVEGGAAESQALSDKFGYFFGSGDPNSRGDLFCLDGSWYTSGIGDDQMKTQCIDSAAQLRNHAHLIKASGFMPDNWGLDGSETP